MSSSSTNLPMTPFCPWREANLSPTSGTLCERTIQRTKRPESSDSVTYTLSTHPFSPWRIGMDDSRRSCACKNAPAPVSSKNLGGLVFPTKTSPPSRYFSGCGSPSASRWLYEPTGFRPLTSSRPVPGISISSTCPPGKRRRSAL